MFRKNVYTWHRRLSLIIALPLVLSAGSGLLHPIMTNIRPAVATQELTPVAIDSSQLRFPLQTALDSHRIAMISKVRVVHIDTNWFYQIQRKEGEVPEYISTRTTKILPHGDYLYARYLARMFLEGPPPKAGSPEQAGDRMEIYRGLPDCCTSATAAVLDAKGNRVIEARRLDAFDEEYAGVNRLLPVYKVAFDRPDGIRIYVETMQDRFALAVDNRRAAFNKVFQYIHTYQWLDFLGKGKHVVVALLIGLAFVTTLLGIYIFFNTRSKRVPGDGYVRARRSHRYTAIAVSLFTAMFTFSGAWHAMAQWKGDTRHQYVVEDRFATDGIRFDFAAIRAAAGRPVAGISLLSMEGTAYWRVILLNKDVDHPHIGMFVSSKGKDLMRDMEVRPPELAYLRTTDYAPLPDGDARYARYLATQFSGHPDSMISATADVTRFDGDYNFTQKRLPVWKVSYPFNHRERYYVETSSGSLSVRVDDTELLESYSFAFFHKHEFLAGLGKSVKDASTVFWATAQLLMVALGLTLYFKARKRRMSNR